MIRLFLTAREVNLLLRDLEGAWRYEGGCLTGRVKLPLGAVNLVVVPSQQGDFLIFTIPFDQLRGDITRGLMGGLVKMLWGFISERVARELDRLLASQGLPRDTVTLERREGLGRLSISLVRLNQWLARQRLGSLRPFVHSVHFPPSGLALHLGLYGPPF